MPYTPPAYNAVNINFSGSYTPPVFNAVAINFTDVATALSTAGAVRFSIHCTANGVALAVEAINLRKTAGRDTLALSVPGVVTPVIPIVLTITTWFLDGSHIDFPLVDWVIDSVDWSMRAHQGNTLLRLSRPALTTAPVTWTSTKITYISRRNNTRARLFLEPLIKAGDIVLADNLRIHVKEVAIWMTSAQIGMEVG